MTARVPLRSLPDWERPRERLARLGPAALSDAELLAILLRTGDGSAGASALDLAHRLLAEAARRAGDARRALRYLATASLDELAQLKGIGPAKAAQVKAGVELGRRVARDEAWERPLLRSPADVARFFLAELRDLEQEQFHALLLDTRGGFIAAELISVGDLSGSPAHPREVFKAAVRKNAHALILVHNHPSGDPTPSPLDVAVTRRLVEAGRLLGIEVLDHLVIGDNSYVSLRQQQAELFGCVGSAFGGTAAC